MKATIDLLNHMQRKVPARTTPEGIKVEVGQVWRNLGKVPRQVDGSGKITITSVFDFYVEHKGPPRRRIQIKQMYKHSTGWELVSQPLKETK